MPIDMGGFIDDVFTSTTATRQNKSLGSYVDGIWVEGTTTTSEHVVNIQPLNGKDINFLQLAGERISDTRKVYVNDGTSAEISEADIFTFSGIDGSFKCFNVDNRPWHNYCRFYAVRLDT